MKSLRTSVAAQYSESICFSYSLAMSPTTLDEITVVGFGLGSRLLSPSLAKACAPHYSESHIGHELREA
jgi:hypothetical protein